ncbi:fasciclin domain-containing protein [Pontiella agarivorans]|uniref:Fasciclin domain-containing protein n=1 Tax=Pontiella agarivorans TaxID=3038953 RepID=A0ABU5MYN3_9BACT|nr:fasciclin domain-containing protein [Pontiella agarivorans]MDZ8119316.1 fasciclin domain-containing protein [Pontiella agarivorans]
MKMYRKMMAVLVAFCAMTVGALASPLYYTILHALDEDTMEVFRDGGQGSLSISWDGGETFKTVSNFRFDRYGRAFARTYALNHAPDDAPLKLAARFNESDKGQPLNTEAETTVGAFKEELMPYKRYRWLTYAPVYVGYENLPSIAEIAINDGRFTKLVAAVVQEGLAETLSLPGDYTVFAPTDDAFAALGLTDEELLNLPNLKEILLYHVLPAALNGDAVAVETLLETLLEKDVNVSLNGGDLFINDSKVIIADIEASNGIIHVIDAVLLPPTLPSIVEIAVNDGRFETLVAAVQKAGLVDALNGAGPLTVFAPTDDAFAALLTALDITAEELLENPDLGNILLYHVVDGRLDAADVVMKERLTTLLGEEVKVNVTADGVFINNSKIIITDIKAENGIIHVIDTVLIPEEMPDLVDTAIAAGQFTTLVSTLQATGLDEVLRGDGPFTVFAPTDDAFEKLPSWLLNFLVRNPKYLEQVLLYHVVPGDLNAEEVFAERSLKTASGRTIYPRLKNGVPYINRSEVIAPDIEAENGTVHVIDTVLIPWF